MTRVLSYGVAVVVILLAACRTDEIGPEPVRDEPISTEKTAQTDACNEALAGGRSIDFGEPLRGLTPDQLARFEAGKEDFEEEETPADGLGPVFNDTNCAVCHVQGGIGGAGELVETRFGRRNRDGTFDPLTRFGGSLIQNQGITNGDCEQPPEEVPAEANVVAGRQTTPLFGLGLLDAVPEATLLDLQDPRDRNRDGISGRVNVVTSPATGRPEVGRFGWKAQVPSLFVFSGDAYLNEMGITNNLFPTENAPLGGPIVCDDAIPEPELDDEDDDGDGISDGVEAFTDFMQFLAPPPVAGVASPAVYRGAQTFVALQCASCHQPALVTGRVPGVAALSRQRFFPFTDLLLHDMGTLGDGIEQGRARGSEIRTAPLWGLRVSAPYLHDGRAATIRDAIVAHDGEASRARDRFMRLRSGEQADLLAFLGFI
jgi:CxxC motif-containing protein (DUF1111 family)